MPNVSHARAGWLLHFAAGGLIIGENGKMHPSLGMVAKRAAEHLIGACGRVRSGERVLIISDASTAEIATLVHVVAGHAEASTETRIIPPLRRHGKEPPEDAAQAMLSADLVIGLTRHSMAHTRARVAAGHSGARYLSLPDYSPALMNDPAIMVDYAARYGLVRRFADAFTHGHELRVQTRASTDIRIAIEGRIGNACPGCVLGAGDLGSPPDIEANVSPLETGSNGVVVVDGLYPLSGNRAPERAGDPARRKGGDRRFRRT
ncbi:hypothetical protein KL86APRO_12668 [uncultured Alphaproteobacteria bacterium]|uniref:Uncharacterized protein n=1 Tax=uncultured Alphaproteobacteria bacterium TaxID=91750 RepID=A0A212KDM9_9PROT|nr:hypothetical protein KL86APRO_12668 [uncultured Alphaproteobacteria bacterium]